MLDGNQIWPLLTTRVIQPTNTTNAIVRSIACGLVYALLWGVYVFLGSQVFGDEAFEQGCVRGLELL